MSDQTINRLLDMFEQYGMPVMGVYLAVSAILFVIVFGIAIYIFVTVFKGMKKFDEEFDEKWSKHKHR